jgi:NADPH-dependent FMN reductase
VFVVAEYNHSVTAALKNAPDQAYVEWVRKPFSALGYGSTGGARAIEHLRGIGVELQMAPSKLSAHIGGSDMFKVHPFGGNAPISESKPPSSRRSRPCSTISFGGPRHCAPLASPANPLSFRNRAGSRTPNLDRRDCSRADLG